MAFQGGDDYGQGKQPEGAEKFRVSSHWLSGCSAAQTNVPGMEQWNTWNEESSRKGGREETDSSGGSGHSNWKHSMN